MWIPPPTPPDIWLHRAQAIVVIVADVARPVLPPGITPITVERPQAESVRPYQPRQLPPDGTAIPVVPPATPLAQERPYAENAPLFAAKRLPWEGSAAPPLPPLFARPIAENAPLFQPRQLPGGILAAPVAPPTVAFAELTYAENAPLFAAKRLPWEGSAAPPLPPLFARPIAENAPLFEARRLPWEGSAAPPRVIVVPPVPFFETESVDVSIFVPAHWVIDYPPLVPRPPRPRPKPNVEPHIGGRSHLADYLNYERELVLARRQALFDALPADIADELREIMLLAHPDRWGDDPRAHEIAARLSALRDKIRARAATDTARASMPATPPTRELAVPSPPDNGTRAARIALTGGALAILFSLGGPIALAGGIAALLVAFAQHASRGRN